MTKMCVYCGVRPVRPAKPRPGDTRRIRVKYCEVCRCLIAREGRRSSHRRFREKRKMAWVDDPCIDEEGKYRQARLRNIGRDYLKWKRASRICPEEYESIDLPEEYE